MTIETLDWRNTLEEKKSETTAKRKSQDVPRSKTHDYLYNVAAWLVMNDTRTAILLHQVDPPQPAPASISIPSSRRASCCDDRISRIYLYPSISTPCPTYVLEMGLVSFGCELVPWEPWHLTCTSGPGCRGGGDDDDDDDDDAS